MGNAKLAQCDSLRPRNRTASIVEAAEFQTAAKKCSLNRLVSLQTPGYPGQAPLDVAEFFCGKTI